MAVSKLANNKWKLKMFAVEVSPESADELNYRLFAGQMSSAVYTFSGRSEIWFGALVSVLWINLKTSLRSKFDRSFSGFLYFRKFTLKNQFIIINLRASKGVKMIQDYNLVSQDELCIDNHNEWYKSIKCTNQSFGRLYLSSYPNRGLSYFLQCVMKMNDEI